MNSKIRIRIGEIEVEYEGTEEFLKKEVPELLKTVSELYRPVNDGNGSTLSTPSSDLQLSMGNIAAKLDAKTEPDLVIAACAYLSLVKKEQTYDRGTILTAMKGASGFYKNNYSSNLTKSLHNLVKKGDLVQNAKGSYTLSANKTKDLGSRLNQQ